jgi:O-antigen ligase
VTSPKRIADGVVLAAAVGVATALTVALGRSALWVLVAAIAAVMLVRHPPVLLAAFGFVLTFKALDVVARLPVDPTFALGALLVGVCAYRLRNGRVRMPPPLIFIAPLAVITLALAIGLGWTPEPSYGHTKVLKFVTVTLLAAFAPFFVIENRRDLLKLGWSIAAGALVVAILAPLVNPTVAAGITTELDTMGRYSFGGQIYPARFLCNGAIVLFLSLNFITSRWRVLFPAVGVGVVVIAVGFGSRGPIAAFVMTIAVIAVLATIESRRLRGIWVGMAVVLAAVAAAVQVPGVASQRLTEVATNPANALRNDPRYPLYQEAVSLTKAFPLKGVGTGGFELYGNQLSPRGQTLDFPHNVFLELSSELGLVPPLVLLAGFIALFVRLIGRIREWHGLPESQIVVLVLALSLYNLLASQFSGDINDNRALWMFFGVAALIARHPLIARRES